MRQYTILVQLVQLVQLVVGFWFFLRNRQPKQISMAPAVSLTPEAKAIHTQLIKSIMIGEAELERKHIPEEKLHQELDDLMKTVEKNLSNCIQNEKDIFIIDYLDVQEVKFRNKIFELVLPMFISKLQESQIPFKQSGSIIIFNVKNVTEAVKKAVNYDKIKNFA